MAKRCIYCKTDIEQNCVVDMCPRCMHGVWGEKMTNLNVSRMNEEKAKGNLELGRVSG